MIFLMNFIRKNHNMKNNSIIIIGNGPSVLDYNFGKLIDKHPLVARINNYQIDGYEKKIGSKTDVWFNGANSKLKIPNKTPEKTVVLIPSEIIKRKNNNLNRHVQKRLKNNNLNPVIISLNDISNFEKNTGLNRLTTGLYSILWAIENYEEVIIHGFDFFQNSKGHYYNSKMIQLINTYILNKGHKHNNELEQKYVKKLIKNDNIKRLIDLKKEIGRENR